LIRLQPGNGGSVTCDEDMDHKVDAAIMTTESVLFDAIYVPGGKKSVETLQEKAKFVKFINEAFKHCKAIAVDNEAEMLLEDSVVAKYKKDKAILINEKPKDFIAAIAKHRNWDRLEVADKIAV